MPPSWNLGRDLSMTARTDALNFDLLLESEGSDHYARVLGSPVGEASARFDLPISDLELENFLLRVSRPADGSRRDPNPPEFARNLGARLHDAVLSGDVGVAFRRSLDEANRAGRGLRIRLRLGDPALSDLPWELMYSQGLGRYLSLSVQTPIVRYMELRAGIRRPLLLTPPLRILVVISSPTDLPMLDPEGERHGLTAALGDLESAGQIEVRILESATLTALQRELFANEIHVLHFHGPGTVETGTGGRLAFKDQQGVSRLISSENLGALLSDTQTLRLAVFVGPEGARTGVASLMSRVAETMVRRGVPAAVAMQFATTDEARTVFWRAFYQVIAEGGALDLASAEGRKAVFVLGSEVGWAAPAVYMAVPDGVLFDIAPSTPETPDPQGEPVEGVPPGGRGGIIPTPTALPGVVTEDPVDRLEAELEPLRACQTTEAIAAVHRSIVVSDLRDALTSLKSRFATISHDVEAALAGQTTFSQREALGRVLVQLQGLSRELEREVSLAREPIPGLYRAYAEQFAPIAARWRDIVSVRVRMMEIEEEQLQEIGSPYVVGVPLRAEQSVFIGRSEISARIETLLLHEPAPSLLLYGQRRMGKTSLLNNLGRLLPSSIVPLFVDLQGPPGHAEGHASLLYHLADAMASSARRQRPDLSVPMPARDNFSHDSFTRFFEWLDEFEASLEGRTALLMLDEFEALDRAFDQGRFDADPVLGMLRHLIQHKPSFKVMLSGSHTLEYFKRWSTYLINVQVVKVGYLTEAEARHLIERPVPEFQLQYHPRASRRVLDLTRCHPFLLQLLCAEVVALKNEQPADKRRRATAGDVEEAVPRALESGSMFFYDIQQNQVDANALGLLQVFAGTDERATFRSRRIRKAFHGDVDSAIGLLLQRDLIEETRGGYRVQVELIRRWFAR